MLFSFFHSFVRLKQVILFSRLILIFPIFIRVMKNYKKLPIDPTPTPPTLTLTSFRCPLTRKRGPARWGGGKLGGGGYVGAGVRWGDGGT